MAEKSHFSRNEKVSHLFGHYVNETGRVMVRTLQQNFRDAGYSVTAEQWIVLVWLFDEEGRTQQELCDLTFKDKPSISRILKNLEKNHLVFRKSDPHDGRSKRVFLTDKAQEMENKLLDIAQETVREATRGIPDKDLIHCRNVLNEIVDNLV